MIRLGHQLVFPDAYLRDEDQDPPIELPRQPERPRDRDGWQIATDRIHEVYARENERWAA